MMQREQERAFELLRTELGANLIEVHDERTGRILWRKSHLTGCAYDSSSIDSKSQISNGRSKEISDDGRI